MRILVNVIAALMIVLGITWYLQTQRIVPVNLMSRQIPGADYGIWIATGGVGLLVLGSMFREKS